MSKPTKRAKMEALAARMAKVRNTRYSVEQNEESKVEDEEEKKKKNHHQAIR